MEKRQIIGVVGGVGPQAGVDLVRKIFDETIARTDQDHLPVVMLSYGDEIENRTSFLLGKTKTYPGHAIGEILLQLEQIGATVAGIPCNTAHASPILDVVLERLARQGSSLKLVHMIEEVARFLGEAHPGKRRLGLLSTLGTAASGVYQKILEPKGFQVILPSQEKLLQTVHAAIADPEYGIKSKLNPVTERAMHDLFLAIDDLEAQRVEAIILGCTELPLAITESSINDMVIIDPNLILARALIREVNPAKLKPLNRM